MRMSEQIGKLTIALAKAQAEIEDPTMGGEGQVGGGKSAARKYPYALLADVLKVARKALGAHGIILIQATDIDRNVMITRLLHSSGEWLEVDYPLAPRNQDPQRQGSANTYARRYALMTLLGIAGERDDDGAAAKGQGEVDVEAILREGSTAGRAWLVKQYLAKAADGYSGPGFAAALKKAKIGHQLDHIKMWCLWLGKDKPSRMKPADRDNLIKWLGKPQGKESWKAFIAACGPLRRPKKKEPEPDRGAWTSDQADAFGRRLKELEFTLDEVGSWCLGHGRPHPSAMEEEKRVAMLAWMTTDVEQETGDPKNGMDTILAWLESQKAEEE